MLHSRYAVLRLNFQGRKILKKDLKGEANVKQMLHAFSYVQKALEIIVRPENK